MPCQPVQNVIVEEDIFTPDLNSTITEDSSENNWKNCQVISRKTFVVPSVPVFSELDQNVMANGSCLAGYKIPKLADRQYIGEKKLVLNAPGKNDFHGLPDDQMVIDSEGTSTVVLPACEQNQDLICQDKLIAEEMVIDKNQVTTHSDSNLIDIGNHNLSITPPLVIDYE